MTDRVADDSSYSSLAGYLPDSIKVRQFLAGRLTRRALPPFAKRTVCQKPTAAWRQHPGYQASEAHSQRNKLSPFSSCSLEQAKRRQAIGNVVSTGDNLVNRGRPRRQAAIDRRQIRRCFSQVVV
jgi:hypothetical protein